MVGHFPNRVELAYDPLKLEPADRRLLRAGRAAALAVEQ